MAPETAKKSYNKKPSNRYGMALSSKDFAIIARLEKRWFTSKLTRPRISDVIRKALEVAEQSGI